MKIRLICNLLLLLPAITTSHGALLFYENFHYTVGSALTGAGGGAGSIGVTGTWSSGSDYTIGSSSLSYGSPTAIPTSGSAANLGITNTNPSAINLGTTLTSTSVLDDGNSLWFSYIQQAPSGLDSNGRIQFSIANTAGSTLGYSTFNDRFSSVDGRAAVGVSIRNNGNRFRPNLTNETTSSQTNINDSNNNPGGDTQLVVGRITWGATSTDDDILTVFLPGDDLMLGTAIGSQTLNIDQSQLDTILIASRNNNTDTFIDEIKIGESALDLGLPEAAPEPSTLLLTALGLLGLLQRKRG